MRSPNRFDRCATESAGPSPPPGEGLPSRFLSMLSAWTSGVGAFQAGGGRAGLEGSEAEGLDRAEGAGSLQAVAGGPGGGPGQQPGGEGVGVGAVEVDPSQVPTALVGGDGHDQGAAGPPGCFGGALAGSAGQGAGGDPGQGPDPGDAGQGSADGRDGLERSGAAAEPAQVHVDLAESGGQPGQGVVLAAGVAGGEPVPAADAERPHPAGRPFPAQAAAPPGEPRLQEQPGPAAKYPTVTRVAPGASDRARAPARLPGTKS